MLGVIVPVYNAEKTLKRCLDSILSQSYSKLKVVLVNDGSTDGSLELCKYYENTDARVKVIDCPNRGVSAARNSGLTEIPGAEFFTFVDADDYIEKGMFEKLVEKAEASDADLIWCGMNVVEAGQEARKEGRDKEFAEFVETRDPRDFFVSSNKIMGNVCRVLYRYSVCGGIRFDENLFASEDLLYLLKCIRSTDRYAFLSENLYDYCIGSDFGTKYLRDVEKYLKNWESLTKSLTSELSEWGRKNLSDAYAYKSYFDCATYILNLFDDFAPILAKVDRIAEENKFKTYRTFRAFARYAPKKEVAISVLYALRLGKILKKYRQKRTARR